MSEGNLHPSFLELKTPKHPKNPKYDPDGFGEYFGRVKHGFSHIPEDAFREWIYPFWEHAHIQKLYGNLDFRRLTFSIEVWSLAKCLSVGWYSKFDRVERIENNWSIEDFISAYRFNNDLVDWWLNTGTWLKPIWVLDAVSFENTNLNQDIKKPYMLIEGHSRLGALRMFNKNGRANQNNTVWTIGEIL